MPMLGLYGYLILILFMSSTCPAGQESNDAAYSSPSGYSPVLDDNHVLKNSNSNSNNNSDNYSTFVNPSNPFISNSPVTPIYTGTAQNPPRAPYQNPLRGLRTPLGSTDSSTGSVPMTGTGSSTGGAPAISTVGAEQSYNQLKNTGNINRSLSSITSSISQEGMATQSASLTALGLLPIMKTHLGQVKSQLTQAISLASSDPFVSSAASPSLSKLLTEFTLVYTKASLFDSILNKINNAVNECVSNANKEADAATGKGNPGSFRILAKQNAATAADGVTQLNTLQLTLMNFAKHLTDENKRIQTTLLQTTASRSAGSKALANTLSSSLAQIEQSMTITINSSGDVIKNAARASQLAKNTAQNANSIADTLGSGASVLTK